MHDHDDDQLTPELERVAQLLRRDEAVRPAWRTALLDEVAHTPRDSQRPRGVHLSIPMAIAAGLICAIGGGAISYVATHRANEPALSGAVALQPSGAATSAPLSNVTNMGATLPVRFTVAAPQAASVSIVGDFNHWNPTTLPMTRSADGKHWEVEVRLPLGRYSYAFLIDGKISPDPAAPQGAGDDFGAPNSVLMVRGS
jgi:hypothetical protein